MPSVMTVLGPIHPKEIGITAVHEHLFAGATSNRFDADTRLDDMDSAIGELWAFKAAGGDTMVEVTTIDMGRDVNRLVELAEATGVKIIAATGYYKGAYSPNGGEPKYTWEFLPEELRNASVAQLAEVMLEEVRQGVAGTNVKPGIIGEIGTSHNQIMEAEEKVFRAAARVNRATGIPISTHTTLGTMGREQVKILKEEGADLRHVVLSHMDLIADTPYHIELAEQGVFLGFDTAGKEQYQLNATRLALIQRLVLEGFEDHIVLSCDIGRRSLLRKHGGRGYFYLLRTFVPLLEKAGIGQATIRKFLVDNPRRLLAFGS
jgi:phosphotriesterase-related protein